MTLDRAANLQDLWSAMKAAGVRSYQLKGTADENRYLYCDEDKDSKGISTGVAINDGHIGVTFELKPKNFDRADDILSQLKDEIQNEPDGAFWKDSGPKKLRRTFRYMLPCKFAEPWPQNCAWLVQKLQEVEKFRRNFR